MQHLLNNLDQDSTDKILEVLSDVFPGVIAITDEKIRIIWANKAFVDLTGYTLEESIGQKPGDFLQGPETDKETIVYMAKSIKQKQSFAVDVLNYKKDNSVYWVRLFAHPVFVKDELKFWIATKYDVTHEKILEKQMMFEQETISAGTSRISHLLQLYGL